MDDREAGSGLPQQPQRPGAGDGLGTVGSAELAEDVADVFFDGVEHHDELVGDLLVRLACGPVASQFIMVTGASSGIGQATAARLADAGHVVFGAALGASALGALAADHPRVRPLVLDVTYQASIGNVREQVETATSGHGLDVLVNVAGMLVLGPVEAVPDDQTRTQFEVNLFGSLAVTRAFLPLMRERGTGRIVNVSSILGRFVLPGSGLHSASKFAIEAYSDALRMELAPFGVRVVLVEPGVIDTPLYKVAAASLSGYDEALEPYRALWTAGFGFP